MSGTGAVEGEGAGGDGGTGDELTDFQYFQAIESTFLLHRGAPLTLSPSDYHVARTWHREGVPLDLVLRKIEEFFERHGEREDPKKVWSLRQCRPRVDAAWKNLRELTAPGARAPEAEPLELGPRLAALARALPAGLPGREELAGRIGDLAGAGDPRAAEARLGVLEEEAVDALLAGMAREERAALEQEVEESLAALADRVPREEAQRARGRLLRQRARRQAGLPTLSLFAPEAQP
ncbi:MAG TPA: hypothetical protein VLF66_08180 [Thermoanaerobaculia bacterium]|nr:hypothetical protein [Thermoanaerobaculia bacterium]